MLSIVDKQKQYTYLNY